MMSKWMDDLLTNDGSPCLPHDALDGLLAGINFAIHNLGIKTKAAWSFRGVLKLLLHSPRGR